MLTHRLEMVADASRTSAHLCWSMKRENGPNILRICSHLFSVVLNGFERAFELYLNYSWINVWKKSCRVRVWMTKNQCTKSKWVDLSSLASHVQCGALFLQFRMQKQHQLIMSTNRAGDRKPYWWQKTVQTDRFIQRHYCNSINDHSLQRKGNRRAKEREKEMDSSEVVLHFCKYSSTKWFLLKSKTVVEMP